MTAAVLDENAELKALLEEALSALDLSRAEVAHAAHEAQCARAGARVLRESLFVRDASALLQSDRLQHAHQEHTHTLSGEHAETEYSLISTAVETTDLRRELHLTQRKLANAMDDISELHTNYDILTHQLLVEQESKAVVESDAHELRAQLGSAGHVLLASAADMRDLQAHVQWLQSSLVESRGEGMQLRGACAQAERSVALLSSDLASSRESAEALRRDLRALQAQGEGRAREQDVSARDLRKELRDADEIIGSLRHQVRMLQADAQALLAARAGVVPPQQAAQAAAAVSQHAAPQPPPAPAPPFAPAPVAAARKPQAPRKPRAKKEPPAAAEQTQKQVAAPPAPGPASQRAQPEAEAAPAVDIDAPYNPPSAPSDSEGESDSEQQPAKKRAKAPQHAPKAKQAAAAAPLVPVLADAAPLGNAPRPPQRAPLLAMPPPVPRAPLASVSANAPSANRPPAAAGDAPKKRKLLSAPAAVDTLPQSYLLGMMGGFAAPKLRPAL